jgi:hypothetical protein
LLSDYTTSDNIQLHKGQHIQIIQRLNNEFCLAQLLVNDITPSNVSSSSVTGSSAQHQPQQHKIEVQIPLNLIKYRFNKLTFDESSITSDQQDESANKTFAAAAKRKSSFKKWLRASHRKFTSSQSQSSTTTTSTNSRAKEINVPQKLELSSKSDLENLKIKVIF